jgi:uracil-DNA glycosylase
MSPDKPSIARAVTQKLESLSAAGVTHIPKPRREAGSTVAGSTVEGRAEVSKKQEAGSKAAVRPAPADQARANRPAPALQAAPSPRPAASSAAPGSREEALAKVAKRVAACARCQVLVENRTQTVFGVGNPHSNLVFIGEAPGADEDRQGEPFVGRAGQLLTDIITKGMKLRREDVYIMNILRCRPPNNRTPLPLEAANCREYLDAQLAIIQPRFICCLGACAAQNLLGVDTLIGKLRGRMTDFNGMRVLCTYHPSYLLRNPPAKKLVWDDIQILMTEMGIT